MGTSPSEEATARHEPDADRFLRIYLADHHAVSTGARDLARRMADRPGEEGAAVAEVLDHIEDDRRALGRMMDRVEAQHHRFAEIGAVIVEKVGRLKRNGRWLRSSPLSPVVEYEALVLGIEGRRRLWSTLVRLAETSRHDWDVEDMRRRVARAKCDIETIDRLRESANQRAFGGVPS
jgi:hypothetical protein